MTLPSPVSDRRTFLAASGCAIGALSGCVDVFDADSNGPTRDPSADKPDGFTVETVAALEHPWGLAFSPAGREILVTERPGRLAVVDLDRDSVERSDGVPEVSATGQGGLLDIAFHPDFPDDSSVYLTYSAANADGDTATHLGRGYLDRAARRLDAFETLHVAEPFVDSNGHYGSRIVFGEDGLLYMTSGDRQFKNFGPDHVSQDTSTELGATLRLEPDGSIPSDNPFVDAPDVIDSIYSYGHRNAQGMAVHPDTGALWQSEHGEEDGDELNIIDAGGNFGWPIATYGCAYGTTDPIGDRPDERDDTVEPVYYWACNSGGFPPAGMTFYQGEAFPEWHGDLFVGNLAGQYLGHFAVDGTAVEELDPLLADYGWRIRDVTVDPETGVLYVAVDANDGLLVRMVPE